MLTFPPLIQTQVDQHPAALQNTSLVPGSDLCTQHSLKLLDLVQSQAGPMSPA